MNGVSIGDCGWKLLGGARSFFRRNGNRGQFIGSVGKFGRLGWRRQTSFFNHLNPKFSAFTLIELLVSMAVLALILAMLVQVVNGILESTRTQTQQMDSVATARRALDVMAVDLQNAVVGENSAILVPSSSGSGTLFASLTTRRAPAASPASRFLAVGYTLNASNQLYRSYAAVNYTNTDLLAATASVITALPVEPLANGILAVQIHAIPENTLPLNLVTDNYNGTPTPTDWNALVTRSPAFASSFKGRTRAIEIWIAAIDQQSLQLLPTAFKPTNAEPSQWRSEVDDSAIPAQAKSSIRILKKTILLP